MNNLSGIILTHNNEQTIKDSVTSIKDIINELIVIDDFSTDKTTDAIKSIYPTARIFQRKLDRFDYQRNFGIDKSRYPWILMIDSDEAISKNLADSIKSQMKNPDGDAYGCIRLNLILGKYAKEKMPRPIIFKNNLKFKGALHENIPSLRLKYLKGFLIHNYWIDTTDWINDINTYSTNRAKKWVLENKNYGRFQLALIAIVMPFYAFTKLFFGQQRWKSGFFAGFLYSLTSSLEWVVVVLKYYEIKYKKDADVNDIK